MFLPDFSWMGSDFALENAGKIKIEQGVWEVVVAF
jgi:hypothetical protein